MQDRTDQLEKEDWPGAVNNKWNHRRGAGSLSWQGSDPGAMARQMVAHA